MYDNYCGSTEILLLYFSYKTNVYYLKSYVNTVLLFLCYIQNPNVYLHKDLKIIRYHRIFRASMSRFISEAKAILQNNSLINVTTANL